MGVVNTTDYKSYGTSLEELAEQQENLEQKEDTVKTEE